MSFACSSQQANNQRNSCTVDVIHITEVEQDDIRILVFSFSVGCIKPLLCKGVNFAVQIHDSNSWQVTNVCLKILCWHGLLLPDTRSIQRCDELHRLSRASHLPGSLSRTIPIHVLPAIRPASLPNPAFRDRWE